MTEPAAGENPKVDPKLLEILVCPVTRQPLRYDAAAQELISEAAGLAYPIRGRHPDHAAGRGARPVDRRMTDSPTFGTRVWPTEIDLDRAEKRLTVTFEDGETFTYPAEMLRVESPSAEVRGHGADEKKIVPGRRHVGTSEYRGGRQLRDPDRVRRPARYRQSSAGPICTAWAATRTRSGSAISTRSKNGASAATPDPAAPGHRASRSQGLAAQQAGQAADRSHGVLHEQALQAGQAVDRRQPDVPRQPDRCDIVGEQAVQPVGHRH